MLDFCACRRASRETRDGFSNFASRKDLSPIHGKNSQWELVTFGSCNEGGTTQPKGSISAATKKRSGGVEIENKMRLLVGILVVIVVSCTLGRCAAFQSSNAPPVLQTRQRCGISGPKSWSRSVPLFAQNSYDSTRPLPRAILFDLDGCLWTPEMYEIVYFMGGQGAPFREDPKNKGGLLTVGNQPVRLLGDVRAVFEEIYREPKFDNVLIGVSSRTDEPDWARELLDKFQVTTNDASKGSVSLIGVLNGPIEIAKDSKVEHFRRIHSQTGIDYQDMVFFDNEYGNCEKVASLGVSVVYCPNGVTNKLWKQCLETEFPRNDGSVINSEERGWGSW